jgi:endonuclease/exonuclease/phosphatase family metal-dependent hydrolase
MKTPRRRLPATLRVASYNIHLGIGSDGRFEPERIAAVLREIDADVVALQEVQLGPTPFDMLAFLRDATGCEAVAGPTLHGRHGQYGNAVLTRRPVLGVRQLDLSIAGREPRGALDLKLLGRTGEVRFVATHLGLRPAERRAQIRRLLAECGKPRDGVTVLLGDLNEWFLWGRPLRWLHRVFAATPAPATFPARRPLFALDRIWVHPRSLLRYLAVHATPLSRVASDHLPITAIVADPSASTGAATGDEDGAGTMGLA